MPVRTPQTCLKSQWTFTFFFFFYRTFHPVTDDRLRTALTLTAAVKLHLCRQCRPLCTLIGSNFLNEARKILLIEQDGQEEGRKTMQNFGFQPKGIEGYKWITTFKMDYNVLNGLQRFNLITTFQMLTLF